MHRAWTRRLAATIIFAFAATAWAGNAARCAVCGRLLPAQYWVYDGQKCCSTNCVEQLKPVCSVCGKRVSNGFVSDNGKVFCSTACFESTLPKCEMCGKPVRDGYTITHHTYCKSCKEHSPTCFSCGLPAAHPTQLADGREICNRCMRWAVKDADTAQRNYTMALRQLQAWTSLKLETVPALSLVDCNTMRDLAHSIRKTDSPVSLRGLYSRQITTSRTTRRGVIVKETTDVDEQIYIVDHLNDAVFRVAAMHELMHDLIQEHFPKLKEAPLWVEEGICQEAAAGYCSLRNYSDILYGIENCTDPDYGDGYRYIKKQVGVGGWPALRRWMESVDVSALPETAPK